MDESIYKQAKNALDVSNENLLEFMDALPQMAWAAQPNGKVIYFNKAWHMYTCKAPGTTDGWITTVHPEESSQVIEAWKSALQKGDYHIECRIRNGADGSYKWFLEQGMPIRDENGKVIMWFGTYTDINNEKQDLEPL
jgi:PAS domain S-box-containing protein